MIAEAARSIDIRRAGIVADLAFALVRPFGLSQPGAERVADAAVEALLDVLHVSDSLAARTAELEAVQALADQHVRRRAVCPSCRWFLRCQTLQRLRHRIRRLVARCEHEADQLARGRHR